MAAIKETKADRIFNIINTTVLSILLLLVLYPLIYVVSASVSDPDMVNAGKMWLWPRGLNFEGYTRVFQDRQIWIGYRNTILITLIGTAINLLMTVTAAFSLSRKDFYGRNVITAIFTFTMFFSGGLIPSYLLVRTLGMRDTIWALIIPGAASMYNIIIARTFFQTNIPFELQEAASIDGCSIIKLFISIILPLSAPILAVLSLFYGVGHWNSFFSALIYISDKNLYPLQLILREILIQNQMSAEMMKDGEQIEMMAKQAKIAESIKYSVIIVSTLPVLVAYPLLQRFFMQGIMVGAIKG